MSRCLVRHMQFLTLFSYYTTMSEAGRNEPFKYYGFISYCSEDERWAKWVHKHLESYHVPTRLCRENPDIPKKIRPVFWYKVDLSGTRLKQSLEKELEVSKYLIVICSPHSAASDWVNDEIISFRKKHGDDRIIPVIVSGEPKSGDPVTECFPPELRNLSRDEEIRGISIPLSGRYHALVDIVATMFNVRFDSLWQRHRRRHIRNCIIGSLLALAVIVGCFFAFDYFRTKREYYANYEYCFGMPVGIDLLKKSELKSVLCHYVFESSQGKLRKVYLSNAFGHPLDDNSSWSEFRSAILDLRYEGNKLTSITFSDANNNPQYKFVYSDDYRRVDIKNTESGDAASMFKSSSSTYENMNSAGIFDLNNLFMNTKSQVARYTYDYDFWGYISKIHFKRYNGSNETGYDDNGICGIEYERDKAHRVIKKRYLDENGKYMADKMGCAGCEYAYDDRGNLVFERFFDIDGNNQLSDMGYAVSRDEYNYDAGEMTERHFGTDEKPIMTISYYHKAIFKVKGDTMICSFFDTEENPTYMVHPSGRSGLFHIGKTLFDRHGNSKEVSFFGTDGAPCYDINRVHRVVAEYDDQGRCISNISYNVDGERQVNAYGVSEVRMSYDDDSNNLKAIEYFRRPGVRANISNMSKRVFAYSGNRLVKSTCYDSNNMPSFPEVNLGAHIVELEYDDFGNVSDLWLKDTGGSTDYFPDTYASHGRMSYRNGNCVKMEYFNKYGRPAMLAYGYSAVVMDYDRKGRRILTEYLDTLGQPVSLAPGMCARMESDYDAQGHETETRTYGADRKPVVCSDGWAIRKQEFKDNLLSRISSYDQDGRPSFAGNIDAHAKELEYDRSRRVISEKYLGLDNQPIMNSMGVSEVRYKYNAHSQISEVSVYDTQGNPVNSAQNFHRRVNEYDLRNNAVAERYFDTAGRPVTNALYGYAFAVSEFGPMGLLLSTRAFGPDSLPIENTMGVHQILNAYTPTGDQIMWSFLNKKRQPVVSSYGNDYFAVIYNRYDDNGKFCGYVSFGEDFTELKSGIVLVEDGVEKGMLWRDSFLSPKLRLTDGTEREINIFSASDADRAYIKMLDSITEDTRAEVKRLIKESAR